MQAISRDNFGPLIAYLVPGATVLVGFSQFSPILRGWFASEPASTPTIGGFLYLTLSCLATGMILNAVRWVIVDTAHRWTGMKVPVLNFSTLEKNVTGLIFLNEIHYYHYQFYANMLIATAITYACYRVKLGGITPLGWPDIAFVGAEFVFFITSRDTLQKFYTRAQQMLSGHTHGKQ